MIKHFCILSFSILLMSLPPLECLEEISKQAIVKSIINQGDPAMFGRLHEKLRARKCIRIAVIGGSVTCGVGMQRGAPTYAALFEQQVRLAFPCEGQHIVTEICKGGRASDYWVDFLVGRQEILLADLDLVVVDTAMNDIHELVSHVSQDDADTNTLIRDHTEILMSLILQKSNRVSEVLAATQSSACTKESTYTRIWTGAAAIWLGTSTRREKIWRGPLPRSTDAVHAQLPVAIAHGIPYISVIDGLGPFSSTASQQWLNYSWYVEPTWDAHPGPWGHHALAKALVHFLTEQHLYLEQLPWQDTRSPVYCPRPPAYVDQNTLDMYLDRSPMHIPTVYPEATEPRMVQCVDWNITSDVLGKPGLISLEAGAQCTIFAFPEEVVRHPVEVGEVHVLMLKSYEHMGWVRVMVEAVPAVSADGSDKKKCILRNVDGTSIDNLRGITGSWSANSTMLGSRDIDCLWEERVSEARMEVVQITKPPDSSTSGHDICLAFTFEVLGTDRAENKIKILGITVF
ncbi:hypothetical protein Vretimale_15142 [Volvox reticuliferus]|uniref:SGNH hydrolase-type esterase domain-containing protein n=1 Tax=Volvox reticuliferus TaxID=1737510 RepID=A0A8J4GQQ8_9CHLO|nr:hypothetical protein Vretimale_15142 [Volvox reticuliferus]